MKNSELKKLLRREGCRLLRQGRSHEIWIDPKSGETFIVPRHNSQEIPTGTVEAILKKAGIKSSNPN